MGRTGKKFNLNTINKFHTAADDRVNNENHLFFVSHLIVKFVKLSFIIVIYII